MGNKYTKSFPDENVFRKEVASKFLWPMEPPPPPLSRSVSNLAQRLLSIPYFKFFWASRCIIMPFWQFYSLESFYKDRKILSSLRSCPGRTVVFVQLIQLATSYTATQVIPLEKYECLETQIASFETEFCTQRVFWDPCFKLQLQSLDPDSRS